MVVGLVAVSLTIGAFGGGGARRVLACALGDIPPVAYCIRGFRMLQSGRSTAI